MDERLTGNSFNAPGDYRIEISGWGPDNSFFVERTNLIWAADGEKQVHLNCPLPEGAMVFVRLLAPESPHGSVPVAYRVQRILPMDSQRRYRMRLLQMHPRCRESLDGKPASNDTEDSQRACDKTKTEAGLHHEEILL